jgi:hypothetical protein
VQVGEGEPHVLAAERGGELLQHLRAGDVQVVVGIEVEDHRLDAGTRGAHQFP